VKFVPSGATADISIRAETHEGFARIWFEDNGIGVPELFRPRLFQMFQRANKTYEGTGIGLALVRKVAERMGGRVGMEPGPIAGSRFWLELRVAVSESRSAAQRGTQYGDAQSWGPEGRQVLAN